MSETCAVIIASVVDAFKSKFWTASLHQELKLEQSQESAYNSHWVTDSASDYSKAIWFLHNSSECDRWYLIINDVGEFVSLCIRWRGLMNRADGHREGFVVPSSKSVSDQRAQFNEAVFLVFSHPLFTSPQMPLLFLCRPPLSLSTSLYSVFSLFLCAYMPFSYLFTSVSSLTALFSLSPSPSHLASNISVFLSPQGGLSHRGRYSERWFRLWVCWGNTAV